MFEEHRRNQQNETTQERIRRLKTALEEADAVVLGAGAGLSTAAGYRYAGERFERYFRDFIEKYGITDMYSGGFYPFGSPEEYWAWWSRHIWVNRYAPIPSALYETLHEILADRDYFVLTTNVDHCFQRAGFDKHRLFYTQGDYGLWQCSGPYHPKTYDNEKTVREMLVAQGFTITGDNSLSADDFSRIRMAVPTELVPRCPRCGRPMTMNLRADDRFVEDAGWQRASDRYREFLRRHEADDGEKSRGLLRLHEPQQRRLPGRDPGALHLPQRRHRRDPGPAGAKGRGIKKPRQETKSRPLQSGLLLNFNNQIPPYLTFM